MLLFSSSAIVLSDAGSADKLKMKAFSDDPRGQWTIEGKKIVNGVGECLDIKGGKDKDGASLISYAYQGSANQHWRIDFV